MPQYPGYEPFTRLWRIHATWQGVGQDFHVYDWEHFAWFGNQDAFDRKVAEFKLHPDYTVDAKEIHWYNNKGVILSYLDLESGPWIKRLVRW